MVLFGKRNAVRQSALLLAFLFCVLAVAVWTDSADAQNFGTTNTGGGIGGNVGGTTSQGLFGQRSVGGIGTSSIGSGRSSGMFGSNSGAGGNMSAAQDLQQFNQRFGQQEFLGAAAPQEALFSSAQNQTQGITADNGLQSFLSQAAQRNFQNQGGTGNSRTELRPQIRLGFTPPELGDSQFNQRVTERLTKLPSLEILEDVNVSLAGRTAVLRGRVATEHDARMIARIALLEPGVDAVQSELLVGEPAPVREPRADTPPEVDPTPPPLPDDPDLTPIPPPIPAGVAPPAPTDPTADG